MKILLTGGAGYIGSHTAVELAKAGHEIIIGDNYSNSKPEVISKLEQIIGKKIEAYEIDFADRKATFELFEKHDFDAVIHFAGLKAVGESCIMPIEYYRNNIGNTLTVLTLMKKYNVKKFVFSSSATVYGDPHTCPITEDFPLSTTNPYGATKLMIEDMLRDMCKADKELNVAILRYFNPVGAHESGLIGEDPNDIPNNLMPYVSQVAVGKLKELSVFGDDYNTHDGTGVRDYIHVVDLANGHLKALDKLESLPGLVTYNLGTGNGYSVLDMVNAFSKASGREVAYKIVDRRPGDVAMCYANPKKANEELGWEAKFGIEEMCQDAWRWQSNNPNGYRVEELELV